MGERYPIRLIKLRPDKDLQLTEGRGPDREKPPKWLLSGDELETAAAVLSGGFADVVDEFDFGEERPAGLPYYYEAKIKKGRTCKSSREYIEMIFDVGDNAHVVGMSGVDRLVVQLKTKDDADAVKARIGEPHKFAYGLSCLDAIVPFKPSRVEISDSAERVLHKFYLPGALDETSKDKLKEIVVAIGLDVEVLFPKYAANLMTVNADGTTTRAICDRLAGLGVLLAVEPMGYAVQDRDPLSGAQHPRPIPRDPERDYPTLGILDSGVAITDSLNDWVVARTSNYPPEARNELHGTMVASAALYADRFAGEGWTGVKDGINIVDAQVVSNGRVSEDELLDNIEEAVARHPKVKVWNLSVSIDTPTDMNSFSTFAMGLDHIQKKYGVLICKSAGNTLAFQNDDPPGRLMAGGDSLRALTVGSVAHVKGENDLSEVGARSPFSCVGPGPEFVIKPEVVHYGGNAAVNQQGEIVPNGIPVVTPDGVIAKSCGTSFSAPLVAAIAAGVYHELGESATPLLVKGLLVHSSRYLQAVPKKLPERAKMMHGVGFGLPRTVSEIVSDDPDSATFILKDELFRGGWVQLRHFPMPRSLIRDGSYTGEVTITVVTDPVLDPLQGAEYCQSELEVKFGTFERELERDTTKWWIRNEYGMEGVANLLLPQKYSNPKVEQFERHLHERTQIRFGKYHPVKKFSFNLETLTDKNAKDFIGEDRHWFLQLKSIFRSRAAHQDNERRHPFIVLITVRDPRGGGGLNREMAELMARAELDAGTLELRNGVQIEVRE